MIEDLIAVNAPTTTRSDIGAILMIMSVQAGEVAPVYNAGCYEATSKKNTGIMVTVCSSVAHTLGI